MSNRPSLSSRNFVAISPEIYFLDKTSRPSEPGHPEVILIFSWLGATQANLVRYADKYAKLYPGASQIIFQCITTFFLSTKDYRLSKLKPMIAILKVCRVLPTSDNTDQAKLLLHVFCNGGVGCLTTLGKLLPNSKLTDGANTCMILDSAPSLARLQPIVSSYLQIISSPLMRILFKPLIWAFFGFLHAVAAIIRLRPMQDIRYDWLATPSANGIPFLGATTKRLYLYGKKDIAVGWEDVFNHARMARKTIEDVREEVFKDGTHVAHSKIEPERYWASVEKLVQDSFKKPVEEEEVMTQASHQESESESFIEVSADSHQMAKL